MESIKPIKPTKPTLKSNFKAFTYAIIETGYTSRLLIQKYREPFTEMINCYYLDEKYEFDGDEEEQEKILKDEKNPVVYIKDELCGKESGITEETFDEEHAKYLNDNYIVPMELDGIICLKITSLVEILEFQRDLKSYVEYCSRQNNIYDIKIYEHDGKETIIIKVDAESG